MTLLLSAAADGRSDLARTTRAVLAAFTLALSAATAAQAISVPEPCPCDCNLSGPIDVTDLVLLVNLTLERLPSSSCPSYLDPGPPQVSTLMRCVSALIADEVCPLSVRSPTPTRRPRPTPTGTAFPPADSAAAEIATQLLDINFVCATSVTPGGFVAVYSEPAGAYLECGSDAGHNGSFDLLKYPSSSDAEEAFREPSHGATVTEIAGGVLYEAKWNPFCEPSAPSTCTRGDAVSTAWAWRRG